jgi:dsRNA-specific ribonuclease
VKDDFINELTRNEVLIDLYMSFIHESYHAEYNYDLFKNIGDFALDMIVVDYISNLFPIQSDKWLTKIKNSFISRRKEGIADVSLSLHFDRYVVYGSDMEASLAKNADTKSNIAYQDMLRDVYKAFLGALIKIISQMRTKGVAYAIVYRFASTSLNNLKITAEYSDVFDSKSQLKELYDSYRWIFDQSLTATYDPETQMHTITIIGYPKGNKKYSEANKVTLATAKARTKREAEQLASKTALDKLDRTYNIRTLETAAY